MALVHRVVPPSAPSPRPPLLVLAHGLGADEEDLLPLAPMLDPRFLVLSVRAPHEAPPMGYAWYALDWSRQPPRADLAGAAASRDLLARFVEEAAGGLGVDRERVFLLGFSQGAIVSLAVGLARPDLVRGVVAHSGRFLPELLGGARPPGLERLEVLLLHGREDPVIPVENGRASREALEPMLGARLAYREWPGLGHGISGESVAAAGEWLAARLGPSGA